MKGSKVPGGIRAHSGDGQVSEQYIILLYTECAFYNFTLKFTKILSSLNVQLQVDLIAKENNGDTLQ